MSYGPDGTPVAWRPNVVAVERTVVAQWWLAEGDERCPHCWGNYLLEVEVRCIGCDGPLCPKCAVTVTQKREFFCPECSPGVKERHDG